MHLKSLLLVALSLLVPHCVVAADDKHKQASRPGKVRAFVARAYCTGRLTALGRKPEAGRTIAADPRVLPLGAHVLISNAGKYSGTYHVADVGGKVRGHMVDVFVRNMKEAREFGRKAITLTVLHVPASRPSYGQPQQCPMCNGPKPNAIMGKDATPGGNRHIAGRDLAAGKARTGAWASDPRQGGSYSLLASIAAFQGAPAY